MRRTGLVGDNLLNGRLTATRLLGTRLVRTRLPGCAFPLSAGFGLVKERLFWFFRQGRRESARTGILAATGLRFTRWFSVPATRLFWLNSRLWLHFRTRHYYCSGLHCFWTETGLRF